MMKPAEYASINTASRINLYTQEASQQTSPAALKIASICNLPVEMKQKIAFHLNASDYASLRATNISMSKSLESFSVMNNKIKQGRTSGHTNKIRQEIVRDKRIRDLLSGNQKNEIILSLQNCFSRQCAVMAESTVLGTRYLPDTYEYGDGDRINDIIELCREGINGFVPLGEYRCFRPDGEPRFFSPRFYAEGLWKSTMIFEHSDINKKSLNAIFHAFNNVYHSSKCTERFVIATLAITLKNHWENNPPSKINRKDIINLSAEYPDLLHTGEHVVKILRGSTDKYKPEPT